MIDPPIREAPPTHRCACYLGRYDRCPQIIASPDQPVCDDCMNAGHPDLSTFRMVQP